MIRRVMGVGRRTTPLPDDWKRIKARVFERDGWQCTWIRSDGNRCVVAVNGMECDHIGDPTVHEEWNLRTLCHKHHLSRTGVQARQNVSNVRFERKKETIHPGMSDYEVGGYPGDLQ